MVGMSQIFLGNRLQEPELDLERSLAGRELQPVGDAEEVRVDGNGRLLEGDVEHDVRRLAADARQGFQRLPLGRNFPAVPLEQELRQGDHVLRLVAKEANRLDVVANLVLAESDHFLRRVGEREQRARRLVDAGVGRLGRENDRYEQRVRVDVLELALGLRVCLGQAGEDFLHRLGGCLLRPADDGTCWGFGFRRKDFGGHGLWP